MLLDKLERQGDAHAVDEHDALIKQLLVGDCGVYELFSYPSPAQPRPAASKIACYSCNFQIAISPLIFALFSWRIPISNIPAILAIPEFPNNVDTLRAAP